MLPFKWYIAGTGNMGTALRELLKSNAELTFGGWLSHSSKYTLSDPIFSIDYHEDKNAGVFLCIPDRHIEAQAEKLKTRFARVVHCSGTQPLFPGCDAVCWPMQTFSAKVPPVWKDVPVFIESSNTALQDYLAKLYVNAGSVPQDSTQEQRQYAHLAAVIANNFSNAMFMFASRVLSSKGLNPDLLRPIIKQTIDKLQYVDIENAQTGPAFRNDTVTRDIQIELLKKTPELQQLYEQISTIIPVLFKK